MPRLLIAWIVTACPSLAAAVVLYDGTNPAAPEAQGWLSYAEFPSGATRTTAGGKTTLSTLASNGISAGYASHTPASTLVNPLFPVLDRSVGFKVRFDAALLDEVHTSTNRAGLSLIALSSDHLGIEIGFWLDEVWAQSATFTKAESASRATTAPAVYELTVLGSGYWLEADGSPILSGSLRDYRPAFPAAPYTVPSFVFVGDNTTSAAARFEYSWLEVTVIPEPAGIVPLAALLPVLSRRRKPGPTS
jgi:hypothetical protein